jgi:hypothetical protein
LGFGGGEAVCVGEAEGTGEAVCVGEVEGTGEAVCVGEAVGVGDEVGTDVGVVWPGAGKAGAAGGGTGRVCCPLMLMVVAREMNTARPKMTAMMMRIASTVRKSSCFGGC